ncbi:phage/plasmid primase, P4 family [Bradyrhizobium sp. PUT101]|uniref:phage/plasmid primase, P4 family n=1 Tax=Bradyrhizobium sp. PUT101 TaxID=3447427 RepID=UPI003F84A7C4
MKESTMLLKLTCGAVKRPLVIRAFHPGCLPPPSPQITFTHFDSANKPQGTRYQNVWTGICDWIEQSAPNAATKYELPMIKLATFANDYRNNANVEMIYGVEGDYDAELVQPHEASFRLTAANVIAFVYTSPSHTPEKPRWRVLAPLSQPCSVSERHNLVGRINGILGGVLANESFIDSQSYYVGRLISGHRVQCFRANGGQYIDKIESLIIAPPKANSATGRKPLGTDRAPDFQLATIALNSLDVNCNRNEWRDISFAFRHAVTGLVDDTAARLVWDGWNTGYSQPNEPGANDKQWRSADNGTNFGWSYLRHQAIKSGNLTDNQRAKMTLGPSSVSMPHDQPLPSWKQVEQNTFATLILMGTHADMATAFAMKHTRQFLYNASRKQWLQWDGQRWADLQPEAMLGIVRQFCTSLSNPDIKRPRALNFWQGVLTTLTTMPEFLRDQTLFDADNYLLNTPTGTIDLRTGTVNPHNPTDHITNIASVAPTPVSDRWKTFITEITRNDQETAKTLQIMLGAALSGAIEEHWIGFLWGNGRNGKSALIEAITYALGDYAKQVPSEVFASNRHEQHPTGLTTLMGGRFTFANEVKEGTYFDTSVLKTVSGDQTIEARYMQGNFFSFKRTFKLFLIGNDLPQIRTQDIAIRSRLKIVPFRADFAGKEDRELPMKLRADAGAVLQWLLEGHRAWIESGKRLTVSGEIERTTTAYFNSQSTPEMWLSERATIIDPDIRPNNQLPTSGMLYNNYVIWKRERGEQPISQTKFGTWIALQLGITKVESRLIHYRGIELKPHPVLTTDDEKQTMPGQTTPPMAHTNIIQMPINRENCN